MRTNLVIDDALLDRARRVTGLKTKKAIAEEALSRLVQLHDQAQVRDLRGKLRWEGDSDRPRARRIADAR